MCLPVVMAALAIAQTLEQQRAIKETGEKQAQAVQDTRNAARMDAERAQQQQGEVDAGTANAHALAAAQHMAAFDAISSEAGSSGATAQRGAAAIGVQSGQDMATIASNSRHAQGEITIGDQAAGIKASQQMAAIQRPSGTMAMLQIASTGVNAYTEYQKQEAATGKTRASKAD